MKQILCFGDSNTWGYTPITGERYDENTRWTCVAQKLLGADYHIVEAGLPGRTSVFDQPFEPLKNGADAIGYSVVQAMPLDLIVIMLGTNDLMFTDARGAARGVGSLIERSLSALKWVSTYRLVSGAAHLSDGELKTKFLIISPILVHSDIKEINPQSMLKGSHETSLQFDRYYRSLASSVGAWYLNAADFAYPSDADGIHMEPAGHLALGRAVAEKVREIFQEE